MNALSAILLTFFTLLPASWTYFAVLLVEVQRINHTQHFINVTAQWQVIDDLVTYITFLINQERTTERHTSFRMLYIISLTNFMLHVSHQSVLHRTNTALVNWGVTPCVVAELRVDRHTNHFYTTLFELIIALIKSDQL